MAMRVYEDTTEMTVNVDYVVRMGTPKLTREGGYWYPAYGRGSIVVDDMKIRINHMVGNYPTISELIQIIAGNKDVLKVVKEALNFHRKNPYRIECRTGMSGACDYSLVSAEPLNGIYIRRIKNRLHVSMYDKLNGWDIRNGIFLPDLIAMVCAHDNGLKKHIDMLRETPESDMDKVCRLSLRVARYFYRLNVEYHKGSAISEGEIKDRQNGWIVD